MNTKAVSARRDGKINSVTVESGGRTQGPADYYISSMPVKDLVIGLGDAVKVFYRRRPPTATSSPSDCS